MHPKKAKDFIPKVASDLNMSEELVKDVVLTYWQEIRKNLSGLKHQRIHLTNLGDFVIKHWKIDDKIEQLERWEESNKQKGMQQMTARFKTAETLYDLKNIKKLIEEESQRATFIKLHKTINNEPKRKHNKNMEGKGTDNGGDN